MNKLPRTPGWPNRIFIWPGTYDGSNAGDTAMLMIALDRLKQLWPESEYSVLTRNRTAFAQYCPGAKPVLMRHCTAWLNQRETSGGRTLNFVRTWRARRFGVVFLQSDLLLLAGCGILADAFQGGECRVLKLFRAAIERGMPTAMLGQGLGPMRSRSLLAAATTVLPSVDALFLREPLASLALARELNVPEERIVVTGDDAVELAYRQRRTEAGHCIGVNLRLARYSGLTAGTCNTVRSVLERKTQQLQAPLLPVAITTHGKDSDVRTMRTLFPEESVPGAPTPESVIRRVSDCRVMVAGSYHAGVFALSQGIPVIAVVQSEYYARKFEGLAAQFACGCAVLHADRENFCDCLNAAIDEAWVAHDSLRPLLRAAAKRQVEAGRRACAELPDRLFRASRPRNPGLKQTESSCAISQAS